jgi:hypothetical protein
MRNSLLADGCELPSRTKLSITDATAIFAWCETGDEAAGAWLCEKYRPLILHIAGRQFPAQDARQDVADETLRRGLAAMGEGATTRSVTSWFAQIALQVCGERARAETPVVLRSGEAERERGADE